MRKSADWFYDEMCTKPVENNVLPSTTKGNIKIYARWAATITYNSQIAYFSDEVPTTTIINKENIQDIQSNYTHHTRTQTYYVGTPKKLYADSPSKGMKLMNCDDNPLALKTWEPWSYFYGWCANYIGYSQGPFKEIGSITNETYLSGYYPWTGNVTLHARYLGNIYHIYLHTNNKDMKINDPNWVQIEDTVWEKKYTDSKYSYSVGYEYRGDSLVLYIYATGKIMFDSTGKPFDTIMTPAVEGRRKFSFYINLPEDTKNTFVWLSPNKEEFVRKKGNANENANYHAFFDFSKAEDVLGWPCYIDSVLDINNKSVVANPTNNKSKANNGNCNNGNGNGNNKIDEDIHVLQGEGKKKVTFVCPNDAALMKFIGETGSKVLYLHVATNNSKYSIYKVNLVSKVMFELY